jgi:hypothetical protein
VLTYPYVLPFVRMLDQDDWNIPSSATRHRRPRVTTPWQRHHNNILDPMQGGHKKGCKTNLAQKNGVHHDQGVNGARTQDAATKAYITTKEGTVLNNTNVIIHAQ